MSVRIVFAVTAVGEDSAAGDVFTAMEFGATLMERFGWHVEYRSRGDDWYALAGVDVVIAMVDDFDPRCILCSHAGLVKIAWARNWFERWCERESFGSFDIYFGSSQLSARYISGRMGKLANILRIGTNPQRFSSSDRPEAPALDYVFTGSYWGAERDIISALNALPKDFRGAMYGKNWQAHPHLARLDRGFVRYADLPSVYMQSAIVIDDANHVTKAWGAANSRVFDALAAGCLVITNSESVSADAFDGELPVYRSNNDLVQLVSHYVNDPFSRNTLQDRLRNVVLAKHCYSHRAFELRLHLERYLTQEGSGFGAEELLAQIHGPGHLTSSNSLPFATKSAMSAVSFVIPLFNELAQTQAMLASLQTTIPAGVPHEIILIDDFSTDGTRDWLAGLQEERVTVHLHSANKGFAASCNAGARLATGAVLCLLNNDLLLSPGWLEPMLEVLLFSGAKAGVVGNVQRRVDDGSIDHAGVCLNAAGQLEHIRHLPAGCPSGGAATARALAVTGACMLLRKADFVDCGGFDEQYRNGGEDMDLCFKLQSRGLHAYVARNSCVGHHVSLSRGPASLNDERNSRWLFHHWRALLKQQLASVWLKLLADGGPYPEQPEALVDRALLSTPHLAALRIAEVLLVRQEARWETLLGPLEHVHAAG